MTTVLDPTPATELYTALETAPVAVIPLPPVQGTDEAPTHDDQDEVKAVRELTGYDYLVAAGWGIASALATTAVSVLFLPMHLLSLTFILGAGLGMLGYLDHCTRLIRNKHNLVFATAAVLLLAATQVISPTSTIIPALIGAAVTFIFMLGLTVATGFAGGGDIKLSPIPAALLAAVSPIAAMMWLLFTFVLCLIAMTAAKLSGSKRKHVAMAPFMAVAGILAIAAYGIISRTLGI